MRVTYANLERYYVPEGTGNLPKPPDVVVIVDRDGNARIKRLEIGGNLWPSPAGEASASRSAVPTDTSQESVLAPTRTPIPAATPPPAATTRVEGGTWWRIVLVTGPDGTADPIQIRLQTYVGQVLTHVPATLAPSADAGLPAGSTRARYYSAPINNCSVYGFRLVKTVGADGVDVPLVLEAIFFETEGRPNWRGRAAAQFGKITATRPDGGGWAPPPCPPPS